MPSSDANGNPSSSFKIGSNLTGQNTFEVSDASGNKASAVFNVSVVTPPPTSYTPYLVILGIGAAALVSIILLRLEFVSFISSISRFYSMK